MLTTEIFRCQQMVFIQNSSTLLIYRIVIFCKKLETIIEVVGNIGPEVTRSEENDIIKNVQISTKDL